MILAVALAAAVLFGGGAYLLLQRDLVRVVAGIVLISHAAVVAIMGSSLFRGHAPIVPWPDGSVSDPLPQALTLTALVIGLATVALLLALVHRVVLIFRTVERDELTWEEIDADTPHREQPDWDELT